MDALDLLDDNSDNKPVTGLGTGSRRRNKGGEENKFKSLLTQTLNNSFSKNNNHDSKENIDYKEPQKQVEDGKPPRSYVPSFLKTNETTSTNNSSGIPQPTMDFGSRRRRTTTTHNNNESISKNIISNTVVNNNNNLNSSNNNINSFSNNNYNSLYEVKETKERVTESSHQNQKEDDEVEAYIPSVTKVKHNSNILFFIALISILILLESSKIRFNS